MRKIILLLVILTLCNACKKQENINVLDNSYTSDEATNNYNGESFQYFKINDKKIELRSSSISDIEILLGNPNNIQSSNFYNEDFYWENVTIYHYDQNNLLFYFDQTGTVFRIKVNSKYNGEILYFEKNIKLLTKESVFAFVNKFDNGSVYMSRNSIAWHISIKPPNFIDNYLGSLLNYVFQFNNEDTIEWIDIYYTSYWGQK